MRPPLPPSLFLQVGYFKAWRCNFLAQAFLSAQKWPEAMALFQRATAHAKKAKNDKMLDGEGERERGAGGTEERQRWSMFV